MTHIQDRSDISVAARAVEPLIVTISGDLGSGKSVLADALTTAWQADRYSTGVVQRELAEKLGITTLELNKRAETDKSIDDMIDSVFKSLADTPRNLVVDSRMAFHFLPRSFRIKLEVHPKVATMRVKGDVGRVGEEIGVSPEEVEAALVARKASERERFKRYYNADIEDHVGYDLVVNTTATPREGVHDVVDMAIKAWRSGDTPPKLWVAPKFLFCHLAPDALDDGQVAQAAQLWPDDVQDWHATPIKVSKVGSAYVVHEGDAYVMAALRKGVQLVPVQLVAVSDQIDMPDEAITENWEKMFDYKHLS